MLKMSTLLLRTLRDDPADAEVASHRLLVRAGYVRSFCYKTKADVAAIGNARSRPQPCARIERVDRAVSVVLAVMKAAAVPVRSAIPFPGGAFVGRQAGIKTPGSNGRIGEDVLNVAPAKRLVGV